MNWNESGERERESHPKIRWQKGLNSMNVMRSFYRTLIFGNGGDDKQRQLYQIKSALPQALSNIFIFFIFIIAKFPWYYAWHCLHMQTQSWHRASFSVKKRKVEKNGWSKSKCFVRHFYCVPHTAFCSCIFFLRAIWLWAIWCLCVVWFGVVLFIVRKLHVNLAKCQL